MKRFFSLCMALLFAGSAFAQEVKQEEKKGPEFKYGLEGLSFIDNTSGKAGKEQLEYNYSHIRLRPSFSLGNENIKGVVVFEIDQDFGDAPKTINNSTGKDSSRTGADKGTDNTIIEVKHAYLEVKDIFIPGLKAKTGLFKYVFPLLVDNDFGLHQASYDLFGMGNINLSYITTQEKYLYNRTSSSEKDTSTGIIYTDRTKYRDDVVSYCADAVVKAGPINIKPAYIYTKFGKDNVTKRTAGSASKYTTDTTYDESLFSFARGSMYNAGLSFDGAIDALGFQASYVMRRGKADYTTHEAGASGTWIADDSVGYDVIKDRKISTYAFDAAVSYKIDPVKVGLFYTQYSGQKATLDTTKKTKYQSHVALMDNVFGAPDGRLFLIDAAGKQNSGGFNAYDFGNFDSGMKIYGANLEAKIDKLSLFAQYAYIQSAQKYYVDEDAAVAGTNTKKTNKLGQEIDLRASIEVAPATSIFTEYAFLKLAKELSDVNKAEKVNAIVVGLTTKI